MNPFNFPFALLAFFGMAMLVPAWIWFVHSFPATAALSTTDQFLLDLVLPATAALFIGGWLQPRG